MPSVAKGSPEPERGGERSGDLCEVGVVRPPPLLGFDVMDMSATVEPEGQP
jgi:hypothetical protein